MKLPLLVTNRAFIRNALYVSALLLPLLANAANPHHFNWLIFSFNFVFLFTAWFEHTIVLNRTLNRRQYVAAAIGSVGAFSLFIGLRYILEQVLFPVWVNVINYDPTDLTLGYYIVDNQYYAIPAVLLGMLTKLVEDWFMHQQERTELVGERNTAELAFLKSQVNPHFLFNTLNNIYSLAYTKSDAAPGAILKLSELMRYMLYDSNGQTGETGRVSLAKEVGYLKNYVELEKLRVANANVQFNVEGNTDLFRIEPLLLVSFVENAFKHGDLTDPNQPLVLDLSVRNGRLRFDTLNKKTTRQSDAAGGIGLANVQRRLALLYPNQHTLHITDTPDSYACSLELSL